MVAVLALMLAIPEQAQLERMIARYAPVRVSPRLASLSAGDRKALQKLTEAARVVDHLYMDQLWGGSRQLLARLREDTSPLGKLRLEYFRLNQSPWSDLDDHAAFLPGVPARKPLGAAFYPEDMTREEFEKWIKKLPEEQRRQAQGFFTVIRRGPDRKLTVVPYSQAYGPQLKRLSALLQEAAALTSNASLRRFLNLRARAFLNDDYFASDVAWLEMDAPLDVTIGPYETYSDELFGFKAAFEAYIGIRDDNETNRLKIYASRLQEIEDNLPIEARYRNPRLGGAAPIRVIHEILAAGDGAHGVRAAAFNLPNDERVIQQKGSKRVMLKNIQEAKFDFVLKPIAARVLGAEARGDLSFDAFFSHILAHELCHGLGPHEIRVGGRSTSVRKELKNHYSAIEEAKADITGLFMLQYLYEHGMPAGPGGERRLYTTFLASAFRSVRFGITEAHGKGMALQFNYLMDRGAIVARPDGTFAVVPVKVKGAVCDLARELLTIEARGDYAGASRMLGRLAVIRPPMKKALERLEDVPTDIAPRR